MNKALSASDAISLLEGLDETSPEDAPAEDGEEPDLEQELDEEGISDVDESTTEDDVEDDPEEDHVEDEDDGTDEPEEPAIDPPVFLDAKDRDEFANLPRDAQDMLQRVGQRMNADYTRKTQEVAERRKVYDQQMSALGQVVTEQEKTVQEWSKVDWKQLAASVSAEQYLQYKAQYEEDVSTLGSTRAKHSQIEQEKLAAHVQTQIKHFKELRPEFRSDKERGEAIKKVFSFLEELGVQPERSNWVTAEEVSLILDGIALRESRAKRGEKTALKQSRQKTKSRPVRAKSSAKTSNPTGKARKRFDSHPSQANAINLLEQFED